MMAKLKTIDGAKMVYKLKGQLEYDAFEKMLDSIVTADVRTEYCLPICLRLCSIIGYLMMFMSDVR